MEFGNLQFQIEKRDVFSVVWQSQITNLKFLCVLCVLCGEKVYRACGSNAGKAMKGPSMQER